MQKFPAEFSDLLNARGRRLLTRRPAGGDRLLLFDGVMDRETARACAGLLDRRVYPQLWPLEDPIPGRSITGMRKNYGELLPKTVSVKTCFLHSKRDRGYAAARDIGLIDMMRSPGLHRLAEAATGLPLANPGAQVICYGAGDYSGPHNDHHPEDPELKDGYVDLHIMFGNDAVAHQWLVYELGGHFREIRDINLAGAIAIYRLPFWHYTTPLAAKPRREKEARRWLLLVSFEIDRTHRLAFSRRGQ